MNILQDMVIPVKYILTKTNTEFDKSSYIILCSTKMSIYGAKAQE
jgi:hypothetical protein